MMALPFPFSMSQPHPCSAKKAALFVSASWRFPSVGRSLKDCGIYFWPCIKNGICLLHSVWEHHAWVSFWAFLLTWSGTSCTSRKGSWGSWACLVWHKGEIKQLPTASWQTMINMMEPLFSGAGQCKRGQWPQSVAWEGERGKHRFRRNVTKHRNRLYRGCSVFVFWGFQNLPSEATSDLL